MKSCRKQYAMCAAIILMILITGICCRIEQAESFFCYTTRQSTQESLVALESLTDASETCTQQLLGRDHSELLTSNRMIRLRTNLRIIFLFLIVGRTLQFLKHIFTTVSAEGYHQVLCNTVIVNYIHMKDGKKS